jgi:phage nucleotide-binding protein
MSAKRILLYGGAGTGKTHFSLSYAKEMEKYGPILFIDTEGGTDTLGNFNEVDASTWNKPSTKEINVIYVRAYGLKMFELTEKIIETITTGSTPYKTVVLDSISELNQTNVMNVIKSTPERKRIAPGIPSQLDYRITQHHIQRLLNMLGSLPTNLQVNAWETPFTKTDDNGNVVETTYSPNLTGKMRTAIPHYYDIVARLVRINSTTCKGYFVGNANFPAKVRHNAESNGVKFPGDIDNPTIQQIMSYFKEQN